MVLVRRLFGWTGLMSGWLVVIVALLPRLAAADSDQGLYLGFGGHESEVDQPQISDNETGFHGTMGYRFNRFMATEVGLYYLGDFSESARAGAVEANAEFSGWTTGIALVPRLPFWVLDVYGKAGLAYYNVKSKIVTSSAGGSKDEETGVNVYGALGGSVNIGRRWSVYLEYSRFYTLERVDTVGIGARFHLD